MIRGNPYTLFSQQQQQCIILFVNRVTHRVVTLCEKVLCNFALVRKERIKTTTANSVKNTRPGVCVQGDSE